MSIDDAIKLLRKTKTQGVKHIVLAFWEADMFDRKDDDEWAHAAELIEDDMDWSIAHEQMSQIADLADV